MKYGRKIIISKPKVPRKSMKQLVSSIYENVMNHLQFHFISSFFKLVQYNLTSVICESFQYHLNRRHRKQRMQSSIG